MRPCGLDAAAEDLVSRFVGFRGWEAGGYTSRMDRVRFGRALGFGARQAVKTLVTAVDAATTESPSRKSGATSRPQATSRPPAQVQTPEPRTKPVSKTAARAKEVPQGLRRGSKRFGEAVWNPFVRLSGVLWLEITGVFFGIFALGAMGAVWRLRGDWRLTTANAASHRSLLGAVAMLVVFGYFCVSSFVRAKRRERRR